MRRSLLILLLVLASALVIAACQKQNNGDDDASPAPDDDTTIDDDAVADDDQIDDDTSPPQAQNFHFDFKFEIAFAAHMTMKQYSDLTLTAEFTPEQRFDVIAANAPLEGEGKLVLLPESYGRMIMLKFQGPALNRGPCGSRPVSYAMALTAKENNGYLVGSVTAYCGADTYTGHPARVMRLSGLQERK